MTLFSLLRVTLFSPLRVTLFSPLRVTLFSNPKVCPQVRHAVDGAGSRLSGGDTGPRLRLLAAIPLARHRGRPVPGVVRGRALVEAGPWRR